ncbi:RL8 [Enterospora canceri]|uniref:RL8 n=1 Tax=Enterospora canceri TaxID=1081671 RepID=A0A1Y1S6W7_9MICR|nr:RL8 [Enterospora canceri]
MIVVESFILDHIIMLLSFYFTYFEFFCNFYPMSKVIRKFRQQKKKKRSNRVKIKPRYPAVGVDREMKLINLKHQKGKGAPLAIVMIEGKKHYICATEGVAVGGVYILGTEGTIKNGNVLQLKHIPEGSAVHSVEHELNDGGHYAMEAGAYCSVENHRKENDQTVLKLPSGDKKVFSSNLRAIVGIVAGAGIKEKPLLKASIQRKLKKSRNQKFPKVRGVAMNPVDHGHGGGNHQHIGFPSTVSKRAPFAQQVGLIGARSTGRRTGAKGKAR